MNDATYQKSLDYIYSFVDYSLTRAFRYAPEKFDLGRMAALLHKLGDPQDSYRVIHLAGTKGKGSTAAMIANAMSAAGYRVGFYTSPHLSEYTERVQVDGKMISRLAFSALIDEIKPSVASINHLTTFEITTALAFLYFARMGVEVAVVEVGLGGRLDATNVVHPIVSIITSISYDHTNVLGTTLEQIAAEKAGIIKLGRPVILAPQRNSVQNTVEKITNERAAHLICIGREYLFVPWTHNLDGQTLLVWESFEQQMMDQFIESGGIQSWEPVRINIPLLGQHQVENAATAYAALQVACQEGLAVSIHQIRSGFSKVFWPCRFEVLRRRPPVVIDSAHNRDSALKLRLTLDDYLPGVPVILVFGASDDKDVTGMFAELLPRARHVIATKSIHPRAMDESNLLELVHQYGKPAQSVDSVEKAMAIALELADNDTAVVVTGSIFIAAAAREYWQNLGNHLRNFISSDDDVRTERI